VFAPTNWQPNHLNRVSPHSFLVMNLPHIGQNGGGISTIETTTSNTCVIFGSMISIGIGIADADFVIMRKEFVFIIKLITVKLNYFNIIFAPTIK
tara:strand:+ start:258 stop:542 length:285 start_codon:yes stop_codon:yes gene_type:complete